MDKSCDEGGDYKQCKMKYMKKTRLAMERQWAKSWDGNDLKAWSEIRIEYWKWRNGNSMQYRLRTLYVLMVWCVRMESKSDVWRVVSFERHRNCLNDIDFLNIVRKASDDFGIGVDRLYELYQCSHSNLLMFRYFHTEHSMHAHTFYPLV
jgi:hypothetical protein